VQYLVEWETTWIHESDLTRARELIHEFISLLPPISTKAFGTSPYREVSAEPTARGKTSPHSKVYTTASLSQKKRARWTPEDNATLLEMKKDGRSWKVIHAAFPHWSKESIQVHYYTKLKSSTRVD
jgi:hypothetical protein